MQLDRNLSCSERDTEHRHHDRIDRPTWHVWATGYALIFIFLNSQLFYSFISVENINDPSLCFILGNFLSFHLTGLAAILVIIRLRIPSGKRMREACLDRRFSLSVGMHAVKITILIVPTVTILNLGILILMDKMNWPATDDPMRNWLLTAPLHTIIILVFGAVVIAPITEEFMFRLVLHKTFQQFFGTGFANVVTSLTFAVFHFKLEQILPLFLLASILQRSFNRSRNILLPISIHSLFNACMITVALIARYYSDSLDI